MLLTKRIMGRVRDRLVHYIEHKLDLTRPDDHGERHRQRYNQSNILTG